MSKICRVFLITHSNPIIHGQAMMSKALLEESKNWASIEMDHLNTVYAQTRQDLGKGGLAKIVLLLKYTMLIIWRLLFHRYDVVIVTPAFFRLPFVKDAWLLAWIRLLTSARVLAWVHMDPSRLPILNSHIGFQKLVTWSVQQINAYIGCGTALIHDWPSFIPEGKRKSIPNGLSTDGLCDFWQAPPAEGVIKIVYLSAMHVEKGCEEAFSAAEKLCDDFQQVAFDFYGNAYGEEETERWRKRFASSRHASRLRWHGEIPTHSCFDVLSKGHVYLFPSYTEQFPMAVLQALAVGLPIISTRVGAVSDAVKAEGGWLIEPRSEAAIYQALVQALTERDRWQSMSDFNRAHFQHYFTLKAFAQSWEALLLRK